MTIKITYHIMPWEIDYALLTFTQLKKSSYYLNKKDKVKIDTTLNLSDYLINWEESKLPKEFFIQKFKDLSKLLINYDHNSFIYEGDKQYGIIDQQRKCIETDVDYYVEINPDMYFSETLLYSLIESAKLIKNKYFIITPQVHKMWDWTWDVLTDERYMKVPYSNWDKTDIFDIRYNSKMTNNGEIELHPIKKAKFCNWFELHNKAFYEEIAAVQDDWIGYGAKDTYAMVLADYIKNKGADFQQYVLKGQTIFDYQTGPLKDRDFRSSYLDLIIKNNVPNQRQIFDSKFNEYVSKGVNMMVEKNIINA